MNTPRPISSYGLWTMLVVVCAAASGQESKPVADDRAVTTQGQEAYAAAVTKPTSVEELAALEVSVQQAIETASPAIVAVGNRVGLKDSDQVPMEGSRFGSGVIIAEDGLILSQYHVSHTGEVDEALGLTRYGKPGDRVDIVLADGRCMAGELLGGDRMADISLLKIIEPGIYPYAKLDTSRRVQLGQWAIKLGHPTGYQPERGGSARLGRIIYANDVNIVANCRLNGGDSGGPVINLSGEIVGLNQDSLMPNHIAELARQRGLAMASMTASRVSEKLDSIRTEIVRDTNFRDHLARTDAYSQVTEMVAPEMAQAGAGILSAYSRCTVETLPCVVEVLTPERSRAAFGSVVGAQGWVVTKASRIKPYPMCRLHTGEIVASRIVGVDEQLDLALLKLKTEGLQSVKWSARPATLRGTFVFAPSTNRSWDVGIVSAPTHPSAVSLELTADRASLSKRIFPTAFEHDIPLEEDVLGGPIVNLAGEVLGISIAPAGEHGFLALPAEVITPAVTRLQLVP